MDPPEPRYRWRIRRQPDLDPAFLVAGEARGLSRRLLGVLAARGHDSDTALAAFLGSPRDGLHDPRRLPDADAFAARVELARQRAESVLVFGDFDADGLTGLAIMVHALRGVGLDTEPYVPDRGAEGHGLSHAAIRRASEDGRTLIVTVDCGTSSAAEIELAGQAGIDVLVTDHHRLTGQLPPAVALVNPQRPDSRYPDDRLAGSGVAFKLAQLLLGDGALELADLAAIGTVADVATIAGENRAIVRLGLGLLRSQPRPGLAALMDRASVRRDALDPEALAYSIVPRLNAVGRVAHGDDAAQLLLTGDADRAGELAETLEAANGLRRELMATALDQARAMADGQDGGPLTIVAGEWPVGIVGLVAGRLADERGRPAVVFSTTTEPWRGSARSAAGFDLAAAFSGLAELFDRFGGHAAAAGCHLPSANYDEFRRRLTIAATGLDPVAPELLLDLIVSAPDADYGLLRELQALEPAGIGNPIPLIGIYGLGVGRVRAARGGHTQLVLRRGREVLDGICFGRDDLPASVREGDQVDVVARLVSRTFGGFESLQLEIRDLAAAGTLRALAA